MPCRDICCVVFALFFKLFVGLTFAHPFKGHLKYTFLVHSDSLVGFPVKNLAQWKTFKQKNCCRAGDKEKSELLRGACFPRVEFPAILEDCRQRLGRSVKRWTEDKLNKEPHQTFVRKIRSEKVTDSLSLGSTSNIFYYTSSSELKRTNVL